jgi:hypothetical protein
MPEAFSACAIVIAGLALAVSISQLWTQRRSIQLQTFEGVFRDIRQTELEFQKEFALPLSTKISEMIAAGSMPGSIQEFNDFVKTFEPQRITTGFALFNSIEFMALLINTKRIYDEKLRSFFYPAIPLWYEQYLVGHFKEWAEDNARFPEFKRLYHTLKKTAPLKP